MRIIFDGPLEDFDAAVRVLREEFRDWERRYNKIGWGWQFGPWSAGQARFFVRRIKDGLSIKATPPAESGLSGRGDGVPVDTLTVQAEPSNLSSSALGRGEP